MQHSQTVALSLQDNKFVPANETAKLFADLKGCNHLDSHTIDLIEKIGGFDIVVAPYARGAGAMATTCQVIRLPKRVA